MSSYDRRVVHKPAFPSGDMGLLCCATSLEFWRFQRINEISSESGTINKWAFENDGEGDLGVGIHRALDFFKEPHLPKIEEERNDLEFEPTRQGSISNNSARSP